MRRIHEPLQPTRRLSLGLTRRLGRDLIDCTYILGVQIDHLGIRHDALRRRRLGENNAVLIDVPAEQDVALADAVFLGDLLHAGVCEERAAGRAEGAVGLDDDAVFGAQVDDLLLREQRVVFDLVDGGDDVAVREELFEVFDAVVAHADRLDFAGSEEFFHSVPRLHV